MLERLDIETASATSLVDHYSRYLFASQFLKGKNVLDAACGVGYGTHFLKEMGAGSVTGVDISNDAIQYAKSKYSSDGLNFLCGDVKDVKNLLKASRFDAVVSFETIEHIHHPEKFISEISELLAPEGIFISSVPDDIGNGIDNPYHVNKFTRRDYHEMLSEKFPYMESFTQYLSFGSQILPGAGFTPTNADAKLFGNQRNKWWHRLFSNVLPAFTVERSVDAIGSFCFIAVCAKKKLKLSSTHNALTHSVSAWHEYNSNVKNYERDLQTEIAKLRLESSRFETTLKDLDHVRTIEYKRLMAIMEENEKSFLQRDAELLRQIEELTSRCINYERALTQKK